MHIFEILKPKDSYYVSAKLVATNNPFVNGRIVSKNEYKTQEVLLPGTVYKLSADAVKADLTEGVLYEVAGSWIKGVLHLTSAKAIDRSNYWIGDKGYTCMVSAGV